MAGNYKNSYSTLFFRCKHVVADHSIIIWLSFAKLLIGSVTSKTGENTQRKLFNFIAIGVLYVKQEQEEQGNDKNSSACHWKALREGAFHLHLRFLQKCFFTDGIPKFGTHIAVDQKPSLKNNHYMVFNNEATNAKHHLHITANNKQQTQGGSICNLKQNIRMCINAVTCYLSAFLLLHLHPFLFIRNVNDRSYELTIFRAPGCECHRFEFQIFCLPFGLYFATLLLLTALSL